jgi:hypothetical protein
MDQQLFGTKNLVRKLGELFNTNMQKDLPKIYKEINVMIETKEKE